ncbi:hypothetical protein QBC40DRAFT_288050 [Triangularia verruculosa]|uniref:DUF7136 domain-containing protein n=1 Tax=Triangularia verruculosa TaxID=2587418 RepID=A0AAN7ASH8_9PEZI|nr:hypothetical protein QBC40DRAFT_288050 [Triangularia verruculosa]
MHFLVWTFWSLVGLFGTTAQASSMMQIDLVFPRNETYTTDERMPVVFSIRNAQLGPLLQPSIEYKVRNRSDLGQDGPSNNHLFLNTNWTDHEPYFAYTFINMTAEGTFQMFWASSWAFCNQTGDRTKLVRDHAAELLSFTIKKDAPATNLLDLTPSVHSCNTSPGVSISISNTTAVQPFPNRGSCALMDPFNPVGVSLDPCGVTIDKSTAQRIQDDQRERLCSVLNPNRPADCTEKKNAAQLGGTAGIGCLAVFVVMAGLLLA